MAVGDQSTKYKEWSPAEQPKNVNKAAKYCWLLRLADRGWVAGDGATFVLGRIKGKGENCR